MSFFDALKYLYERTTKFILSEQRTAIDDLYFTENLQNQSLTDLHEGLAQVETEIANVDADLNSLQSDLNGEKSISMVWNKFTKVIYISKIIILSNCFLTHAHC